MLNKKDPLIGAVLEVMNRNHVEREAAQAVNEYFGIEDRKALPHEYQGQWDAAYQQVLNEGLSPAQQKHMDVDDDEDIDHIDLAAIRARKKKKMAEEALDEDYDPKKLRRAKKIKEKAKKLRRDRHGPVKDQAELIAKREKEDAVTGGDTAAGPKKAMQQLYGKMKRYKGAMKRVTVSEEASLEAIQEEIAYNLAEQAAFIEENYGEEALVDFYSSLTEEQLEIVEGWINNFFIVSNESILNEDDIDSYENRMTAGLGQQYTPYGGGRFGGGSAKTGSIRRRPVRIDTPAIKNTRTGEKVTKVSGPKTRVRPKKQKPVQQQPSGTMAARAQQLAKAGREAQAARAGSSTVAATQTANRANMAQQAQGARTGSSTVAATQAATKAAGRKTAAQQAQAGRVGGSTVAATQTAGRAKMAQQAQAGRVGGSTVAATQTAGRAKMAQQAQAGRVGGSTVAATQTATRMSKLKDLAGKVKANRAAIGAGIAGGAAGYVASQIGNKPGDAAASGPEKIKTSTQTTSTQPDYDKMSFGQAFKAARDQAGGAGGKFKYKGKEYQTNIQGKGTAQKPQEKYQAPSKLKNVAPAPETKTTTSVVGGQGIAAVPGGASKMPAAPAPSAAKERANFAGPQAGTPPKPLKGGAGR